MLMANAVRPLSGLKRAENARADQSEIQVCPPTEVLRDVIVSQTASSSTDHLTKNLVEAAPRNDVLL
jgi:hypothetical protein